MTSFSARVRLRSRSWVCVSGLGGQPARGRSWQKQFGSSRRLSSVSASRDFCESRLWSGSPLRRLRRFWSRKGGELQASATAAVVGTSDLQLPQPDKRRADPVEQSRLESSVSPALPSMTRRYMAVCFDIAERQDRGRPTWRHRVSLVALGGGRGVFVSRRLFSADSRGVWAASARHPRCCIRRSTQEGDQLALGVQAARAPGPPRSSFNHEVPDETVGSQHLFIQRETRASAAIRSQGVGRRTTGGPRPLAGRADTQGRRCGHERQTISGVGPGSSMGHEGGVLSVTVGIMVCYDQFKILNCASA